MIIVYASSKEIENKIKEMVKIIIERYEKLFYEIVIRRDTNFYIEIDKYILGCIKQDFCEYSITIMKKEKFKKYEYWYGHTIDGKRPKRSFTTILNNFSSIYINVNLRTSSPYIFVIFSDTKNALICLEAIVKNIDKIFEKIKEKYPKMLKEIIVEKI